MKRIFEIFIILILILTLYNIFYKNKSIKSKKSNDVIISYEMKSNQSYTNVCWQWLIPCPKCKYKHIIKIRIKDFKNE
jgi:hypothetical protein